MRIYYEFIIFYKFELLIKNGGGDVTLNKYF